MEPVPKALVGRDPRDFHHVETALKIIQRLAGLNVTPSTVKDLQQAGVPLPAGAKVVKNVKDAVALGSAFLLEVGLYFPDNIIRPCNDCQFPLQLRPSLGHSAATVLCAFCAAERLLKEQAEKAQKKARRRNRSGSRVV